MPRSILPSPRAVALALAIVRATPDGLWAKDYALQLRNHLRHGRQPSDDNERSSYIDLVAFWRQRYDTAEQRCRELEAQVATLERSLHILRDPAGGGSRDNLATIPSKSAAKAPVKPPRKTKKVQATKQPSAEDTLQDDSELLESLGQREFLHMIHDPVILKTPDGALVAQHMWTCQKLLVHGEADVDSICSGAVSLVNALGCIFPTIAKYHDRLATRTKKQPNLSHLGQDKSELTGLMLACARAWNLVLMALDKLEDDEPGSRRSGVVIFECVKLVSAALDAVKLAAQQAAWKTTTLTVAEAQQESVAGRNIAHLLATFVGYLGRDNPMHHKLFDGIAYVLIERVGERLYYCTFGRSRGATMEERIEKVPEPTDPHEIAFRDTEAAIVRLEVKALIIVLERVVGVAPLHSNEQTPKKPKALARTISMKSITSTRSKLSSLAQDRLQRTLIACMFGKKINDDFVDVLTKPINIGRPPPIPKVKDEDIAEWYQTQVWRLVGWNLLEKEGDWMK